jgi:hypothetical protein
MCPVCSGCVFRSVNGLDGTTALQCVDCAAVFETVVVSSQRSQTRHPAGPCPSAVRRPVTEVDSPFDVDRPRSPAGADPALAAPGERPAASRTLTAPLDPDVHERETARPPSARATPLPPSPRAPNVSGAFQLAHVTPRRLFSAG